MTKSEDKKLSFLPHPHVTSFVFLPAAAHRGPASVSPTFSSTPPPFLRVWRRNGMDKQTHFGKTIGGQKRGKAKESVAALISFFSIIFCPSGSVSTVQLAVVNCSNKIVQRGDYHRGKSQQKCVNITWFSKKSIAVFLRYGNPGMHFLGTLKNKFQISNKLDHAYQEFEVKKIFRVDIDFSSLQNV